jgi:SAM-dependent MidA family methyltransferase
MLAMIETHVDTPALTTRLREQIKRDGPITFCDWMNAALYDGIDGYYCRADRRRWGKEGDYRTSPERTPLFAATFARYFAELYDQLDRPLAWIILEAGAGDGIFAESVLQTLQIYFPNVFAATTYVIDEVNRFSGARERLQRFAGRVQFGGLHEVEINPGIVFSNELLDAFAVHRVILQSGEFREFYVTLDQTERFAWLIGPLSPALSKGLKTYFDDSGLQPAEGQIIEVNLQIEDWIRNVARSLRRGFVVTVDYGITGENPNSVRETLRGFRRHHFVDDLLAEPGEHDLTTTVNWNFVKSVGRCAGLEVVELSRQDQFLLAHGFLEQLEAASQHAKDDAERFRLSTAAREMILPDGMAASFQVLVQKRLLT